MPDGPNLADRRPSPTRRRRWAFLALALVLLSLCGCRTLSYYGQAMKGQCQIFTRERSIPKLIANPQTPAPLKARLQLVERLRGFAKQDLNLPVDAHYLKYADLQRPFVVWNVEAAPEFSLQPKTWWYPFVGSLSYRGYFAKSAATNYAAFLKTQGYDVSVGGVEAYSTLGWFEDPVLNTFLFEPDADLAETLFHELGHQRLFAHGDTDFNEAFATTVGKEGARRWLESQSDSAALDQYLARLRHTREFTRLVLQTRLRLAALYGDERTETGKFRAASKRRATDAGLLRSQKQRVLDDFRKELASARANWGDDAQYDDWLDHDINNARLNAVATYYDLVPGFERLLAQQGGGLEKFYAAAERLSKLPRTARHKQLLTSLANQP